MGSVDDESSASVSSKCVVAADFRLGCKADPGGLVGFRWTDPGEALRTERTTDSVRSSGLNGTGMPDSVDNEPLSSISSECVIAVCSCASCLASRFVGKVDPAGLVGSWLNTLGDARETERSD